jgi:hypothetical protein
VLVEDRLYGEYLDKEEAILDAVEAAQGGTPDPTITAINGWGGRRTPLPWEGRLGGPGSRATIGRAGAYADNYAEPRAR